MDDHGRPGPAHGSSVLCLLNLQLGEKLHEPLKALLVPVDPEEVDLEVVNAIDKIPDEKSLTVSPCGD